MTGKALGVIETFGFVAALAGADAALKAAEVKLLGCRYIGSGLVSVHLSGDVSSVKAAVDAGSTVADQVGSLRWSTVIARTADDLPALLREQEAPGQSSPARKTPVSPGRAPDRPARKETGRADSRLQQLAKLPVKELRELAKELVGLPLDRRQIRSARKPELIEAIIRYEQKQKE